MKWPTRLLLVRHALSKYNVSKHRWEDTDLWKEFLKAFEADHSSEETRSMAQELHATYKLGYGDWNTPAVEESLCHAVTMASNLRQLEELPNIVLLSPYVRTRQTLQAMVQGWPELDSVDVLEEERVREQEHGLAILYPNWRVFYAFHPEQYDLFRLEGPYRYRWPQGENVPDVRTRIQSLLTTLVREFSGMRVLVITHHLTILAAMASIGRWDQDKFIDYDEQHKPINCGVTSYRGDAERGTSGKLVLDYYNSKLY